MESIKGPETYGHAPLFLHFRLSCSSLAVAYTASSTQVQPITTPPRRRVEGARADGYFGHPCDTADGGSRIVKCSVGEAQAGSEDLAEEWLGH